MLPAQQLRKIIQRMRFDTAMNGCEVEFAVCRVILSKFEYLSGKTTKCKKPPV